MIDESRRHRTKLNNNNIFSSMTPSKKKKMKKMPNLSILLFCVVVSLFIIFDSSSSSSSPPPTTRRLLLSLMVVGVDATTQVKWIPGDSNDNNKKNDDGKETAHTAPRSQKYWDEHNIERPDYAKTDEELYQERRQRKKQNGSGSSWFVFQLVVVLLVLCFPIGYYILWPKMKHGSVGTRLGTASISTRAQQEGTLVPSWLLLLLPQRRHSWFGWFLQQNNQIHQNEQEAARQARLSRFERTKKE